MFFDYIYIYINDRARFTWEKVEDLKMEHCYIAPDYMSEARLFQVLQLLFPIHYPFQICELTVAILFIYLLICRMGLRKLKIK